MAPAPLSCGSASKLQEKSRDDTARGQSHELQYFKNRTRLKMLKSDEIPIMGFLPRKWVQKLTKTGPKLQHNYVCA